MIHIIDDALEEQLEGFNVDFSFVNDTGVRKGPNAQTMVIIMDNESTQHNQTVVLLFPLFLLFFSSFSSSSSSSFSSFPPSLPPLADQQSVLHVLVCNSVVLVKLVLQLLQLQNPLPKSIYQWKMDVLVKLQFPVQPVI